MNNELYHHGILGQRWGIRRTPEQLGHETYKKDVDVYGQKGAERIYRRINSKGMARGKAERREMARQVSNAVLTRLGLMVAVDLTLGKTLYGFSATELLAKKVTSGLLKRVAEYGKRKAERELIPKISSVAIDAIVLGKDSYTID